MTGDTLYQCRVRVGYRPYGSTNLIVFSDREISNATVNLEWKSNMVTANQDSMTILGQTATALSESTCQVTLAEPYMTGASWLVLYDIAAAWTVGASLSSNGILLPRCKEGQDPVVDKCSNALREIDSR